jgi:hypothetical protein
MKYHCGRQRPCQALQYLPDYGHHNSTRLLLLPSDGWCDTTARHCCDETAAEPQVTPTHLCVLSSQAATSLPCPWCLYLERCIVTAANRDQAVRPVREAPNSGEAWWTGLQEQLLRYVGFSVGAASWTDFPSSAASCGSAAAKTIYAWDSKVEHPKGTRRCILGAWRYVTGEDYEEATECVAAMQFKKNNTPCTN